MKKNVLFLLLINLLLFTSSIIAQNKEEVRNIHIDKKKSLFSLHLPVAKSNSDKYIKIDMQYFFSDSKSMDLWRLSRGYYVTKNADNTYSNVYSKEFLYPGEWECAIMTTKDGQRNKDFMGGFHGYEKLTEVSLRVDGKDIDMATVGTFEGQTVTFTQHSQMFEYGTSRPVALHTKEYLITGSTINVKQSVEWIETMDVVDSYLTMLPIARSLTDGTQITDRLTIDDKPKVFDVSKTDKSLKIEGKNVSKVSIWGEESGLRVDTEVTFAPLLAGNKFFCSMYTPQDGYNKLYFNYSGKTTAKQGDIWTSNTSFHFSINK